MRAIILTFLLGWASKYFCSDIHELHRDLFERSNYSNKIAPLDNLSEPLNVYLTYDLVAISKFDSMLAKFVPRALLSITWTDSSLSWNPERYGGVTSFMYPIERVWYPPIVSASSYKSSDGGVCSTENGAELRILFTGTLQWLCGNQFEDACSPNVELFPLDTQKCNSIFAVWGYDDSQIALLYDNRSFYGKSSDNGQWKRKRLSFKSGSTYGFSSLTITTEFQRKSAFAILSAIVPIFVIGLLNLLVFLVEPSSGEKLSYSMTVLLANALFLVIVAEGLPKVSKPISNICIMVVSNFATSVISCACSVLSLYVYYIDSKAIEKSAILKRINAYIEAKDVTKTSSGQDTTIWKKASKRIDYTCFVICAVWLLFADIIFMLSITVDSFIEAY